MKIVIIVDGLGPGSQLVHEFKKHNYEVIHVISDELQKSKNHMSSLNLSRQDYKKTIFYKDMPSFLEELGSDAAHVCFAIPGFELGVLLADSICEQLTLPGNDFSKSLARRDKYEMVLALQKAGVPAINTCACNHLDEAICFANKIGYPVLIKPPLSAGSDGVFICKNEKELTKAFSSLHLTNDFHGKKIDKVIVQTYIHGHEYAVNTVSFAGKHYIADIWKYRKLERTTSTGKNVKLYGEMILLSPHQDKKEFDVLKEYIFKSLDALGVKYGAANNEVFIQTDGSPVLVETGARMEWIDNLTLRKKAFKHNIVELTALSYINPSALDKMMPEQFRTPSNTLCRLKLVSYRSGQLTNFNSSLIKNLTSYHGMLLRYSLGYYIKETTDLFTALGAVFLSGTKKQVEADIHLIREAEKEGQLLMVTSPQSQHFFAGISQSNCSSNNTPRTPRLISRL